MQYQMPYRSADREIARFAGDIGRRKSSTTSTSKGGRGRYGPDLVWEKTDNAQFFAAATALISMIRPGRASPAMPRIVQVGNGAGTYFSLIFMKSARWLSVFKPT